MIFVTVGTHEQQFDRLVKKIDELAAQGVINEDIIIQTGFSTYEPIHCKWSKIIPYDDMIENIKNARIVITHGGPASFIMPLQYGKTPMVVPRKSEFGEHVNNHQVEFCNAIAERMGIIIVVEDVDELGELISNYNDSVINMGNDLKSNNEKFNKEFEKIVLEIMK